MLICPQQHPQAALHMYLIYHGVVSSALSALSLYLPYNGHFRSCCLIALQWLRMQRNHHQNLGYLNEMTY